MMIASSAARTPINVGRLYISRDRLVRAIVWLAVAAGGFVMTEPAPADFLMLGLMALLPLAGLQKYTRPVVFMLSLWLLCSAGAFLASTMAGDVGRATLHTAISVYLYLSAFALAAFIAADPFRHAQLILKASLAAALIAAGVGIAGYFDAVPGAFELFTKFGRAAGTFKDPNVFGPFLVPAILYVVHMMLHGTARQMYLPVAQCLVLGLAMLLSFSRGAWFNLGAAFVVYAYLTFVTASTNRSRLRLALLGGLVSLLAGLAVATLLQIDTLAALFSERSHLTNSYDVGPDGRFGGHLKAMGLILANPPGIGALEFATAYHHEDVHNVYLSMFLNAGWLGGLIYLAVIGLTLALGFRQALRNFPARGLFIIAYAAFLGNVLEGWIVDTDHWRHFYLLLALIWGMIGYSRPSRVVGAPDRAIARRG